jgi:predicted O-methyltransferase YrrM
LFKLRTQIRIGVNALLGPLGLYLTTNEREKAEAARLRALRAKGYWSVPRYTEGLAFHPTKYQSFLRDICEPHREAYGSFARTREEAGADGFFLNNGYFGPVDAEVLYSLIRHCHPRRIVEIGSGFSSRLARRAIQEGGLRTRLTCIDPDPRTEIRSYADEHLKSTVENLDVAEIPQLLTTNDILFIDSSHTIQTGGDVPYLFLEVLPRLSEGVLIHVHDIFLPFDYPEEWMAERRWGKAWSWTEQYLVHAFLAFNSHFEIVWPSRYMWEYGRSEVVAAIPSSQKDLRVPPTSLWLRKVC